MKNNIKKFINSKIDDNPQLLDKMQSDLGIETKTSHKKRKIIILSSTLASGVCAILVVLGIVVASTSYKSTGAYIVSGDLEDIPLVGGDGSYITGSFDSGDQISSQYQKTLTAVEVNDFLSYQDWVNNITLDEQEDNSYANVYEKIRSKSQTTISTKHLFAFNIIDLNDKNIYQAQVILKLNGHNIYSTYSDKFGNAYLFTNEKISTTDELSYEIIFDNKKVAGIIDSIQTENYYQIKLDTTNNLSSSNVDVVFLIDTTGSMADELSYIKNEIALISQQVINESYSLQIGFVLYRDYSDDYITRYLDLSENLDDITTFLSTQYSQGGGDYEEAIQEGLKVVNNDITFRDDAVKLVYHIYDAPCHDDNIDEVYNNIFTLASKGIKLISVAASGFDTKAEIMAREEAIFTGGRYFYLSNDSLIGNSHLEATTNQDREVEYFADAIVRTIISFASGEEKEKNIISFNQNDDQLEEETSFCKKTIFNFNFLRYN